MPWCSKKQSTVDRSYIEVEYRSLAQRTAEISWLCMLLRDLCNFLPSHIPTLWCDNISAISLTFNPVFHPRTKHIEVDYHHVRDKVLQNIWLFTMSILSNKLLISLLKAFVLDDFCFSFQAFGHRSTNPLEMGYGLMLTELLDS